MKCAIEAPYCEKFATWEVMWDTGDGAHPVYWCDKHKEAKIKNCNGKYNVSETKLKDFWEELNS